MAQTPANDSCYVSVRDSVWRWGQASEKHGNATMHRQAGSRLPEPVEWIRYETPVFSSDEQETLRTICGRHELPAEMVAKLIEVERSLQGMSRRASIQRRLAAVFEEDWRSNEELFANEPVEEHP